MIRASVVTISHRAAQGVYADRSGPLLVDGLTQMGCSVSGPFVIDDGEPVREKLRELLASSDLIVTTGGTGINSTDQTPQMTAGILDYQIPGIAEAIRLQGTQSGVPTAVLSRGVVGVAGRTLIINLPGSPAAISDGLKVLAPILEHAISQLSGGDH